MNEGLFSLKESQDDGRKAELLPDELSPPAADKGYKSCPIEA